jgi:transcriptional regulator with XRE-family HTH domain
MKHQRDILWYLDLARARTGCASYKELATRLGLSGTSISWMRQGKSYPADATMLRIADLAGQDGALALLDLNVWRAPKSCALLYKRLVMDREDQILREEKRTARTAAE